MATRLAEAPARTITKPQRVPQLAPAAGRPVATENAYWIRHCEGYRVDGAGGRLGFVDHVRGAGDDCSAVLAVRAGLLGRRLLLVSEADIAQIVPRAERIWLRTPATIVGSESPLPSC
jgi:hypothetical protein